MDDISTVSIDTEIRDKLKIEAVIKKMSIKELIKKIVDTYFSDKNEEF